MGWEMWLGVIVFSLLLWWFSFIATKQMRIDKNRERMEMWEKMAAAQKARREQEALEAASQTNDSAPQGAKAESSKPVSASEQP